MPSVSSSTLKEQVWTQEEFAQWCGMRSFYTEDGEDIYCCARRGSEYMPCEPGCKCPAFEEHGMWIKTTYHQYEEVDEEETQTGIAGVKEQV